jgi:tetratricopeptide (TPR) repeat protein
MNANDALAFTDELIFEATGEHLDSLTSKILMYAWDELTYDQIAEQVGYENSYVRDVGSGLFRQLRKILAEPVDKRSFQAVLQRRWTQRQKLAPASVRPIEGSPIEGSPIEGSPIEGFRSAHDRPTFIGTANFLGRDREVTELDWRVSRGEQLILIHGEGGIGKTTLARNYFQHLQLEGFILELYLAAETQITPAESVVAEWLRLHFNEEATAEWGINLGRLRHKLRSSERRFGVLIDSFEVVLDGNGQVAPGCRCYVELLQMLADPHLQAITLLTSRERLQDTVQPECYPIEGLSEATWTQFFRSHHITAFSPQTLTEIWQSCGGNPKAMKLIGGAVPLDFEGDLDQWWQELGRDLLQDKALKSLVEGQFERLQTTHPAAYQLLCRLGAYRFQDVSYIGAEGVLALLWDVPESERRSALRALQNRCLVEARGGKKFWLHPIIRSAAIARIRPTPDWAIAHRAAAQFWQDTSPLITTEEDALRALEAYHHLIEIGDFDAACDVIITPKDSRWGPEMQLGWLFYRLGFLTQIRAAIVQVLPQVPEDSRSGRLYNLLGYMHRLSGDIHQAIGCHQTALSIAKRADLEQLTISCLFNLGLCFRDLWELDRAQDYFEQVHTLAQASATSYSDGYIVYSQSCLAYVHSCGPDRARARSLVTAINTSHLTQAASTWGTGYGLLFVGKAYKNLREFEAANELFQDTLHHARQHHFAQIEAKALHGLAQVYRELGDADRAVDHHHQALEILARLGARSDQAETYLQLAVTYHRMGHLELMRQMRQKSIDLFRAIQAPRRVQWVIDRLPQE